ncbi:MAG: NERD domain-containing protein [Bacilli bacterium]|nr:NERD domain-containing protein [Bacilli bacterium]
MEQLLKILEVFWIGIKSIISNPTILSLLLLALLMKLFYPKFRGFMGEFWVKLELNKLSKKEYIVLNDIMLENQNGTHQIDHLVISKYGIFVIEMKNYYGLIFGDEYKNNWTQHLGKKKYYFKNPIHQNYGHIKALEEILQLNNNVFIPIICFSNQAKMKVNSKSIVIQLDYLIQTIKKFYKIQLDMDINSIADKIKLLNITNKDQRRKHVSNIKAKIKADNQKADNMLCPKCGNQLVLKNGKYGTFVGCSNYPKCKYIKEN